MKNHKQKFVPNPSEVSILHALTYGNAITRLSFIICGLANFLHKQFLKGIVFLGLEVAYFVYMIRYGITHIGNFITLGEQTQAEVFNPELGIYEYVAGDNSMLFLLYGVITIFITLAFFVVMSASAKSAYNIQVRKSRNQPIATLRKDLASLKQENLHKVMLFIPIIGILMFTIIPLVYMIVIAFTSYDHNHQPPGNLFDWVGFSNFTAMFAQGGKLAGTFWPVLGWTIIWAISATVTCFLFGTMLALLINRKDTKLKSMWRFLFVLSIAVPQFVTLLSMRTIFNANGPVNVILRTLGIIGSTDSIPFFTDPTIAKITIICINIWIGVPFTMLSTTGILQNIPNELYEAARLDGASPFTTFRKITLPYIIHVMTPYLITSFAGNINNFNVIFLLSGGGPDTMDYYYAGKTDLLVTWLYRLTITQKDYNLGAVIGIMTFIVLATVSLITYHRTSAYKNEGAFQ